MKKSTTTADDAGERTNERNQSHATTTDHRLCTPGIPTAACCCCLSTFFYFSRAACTWRCAHVGKEKKSTLCAKTRRWWWEPSINSRDDCFQQYGDNNRKKELENVLWERPSSSSYLSTSGHDPWQRPGAGWRTCLYDDDCCPYAVIIYREKEKRVHIISLKLRHRRLWPGQ